jgi:hypothetical protein
MTSKLPLSAAIVVLAALLVGCGSSTKQYSATKFSACLHRNHQAATLTHDRRTASASVLIMSPAFAEWVYFFTTTKSASAELAKIRAGTTKRFRVMSQLFRTQKSNALVFAPKRATWLPPVESCLQQAQV